MYQLPPPLPIAHPGDAVRMQNNHPVTQQQPLIPHTSPAPHNINRQRVQAPPPPLVPQNQGPRVGDLPKILRYDGTGNWKAFQTKFERYVELKN